MQYKQLTQGLVLSIVLVLLSNCSFAQQSAMEDDIIKISGVTTSEQVYSLTSAQKQSTFVYYDGFDRPIQQVAQNASPLQNDIIEPIVYDNLGRQTTSYLPYSDVNTGTGSVVAGSYRSTALTEQSGFYNQTTQYLVATDADPFQAQVYENSPLQRLLQAGQLGTGFQPITGPKFKTISYRPNSNALDGNIAMTGTTGTFTTFYTDNTLWVTDGKDEDNEETLIYKDITGQVVLKRQLSGITAEPYFDTYYIYNNAGSIAYIVPPKATYSIMHNGNTITTVSVQNLIYTYNYNTHGQLISKTAPGSGTVTIIYDPLNRPVLAQDVNNAAINQWYYIKYDNKGRVAITGTYIDAAHNASNMQTYVNGLSYSTWYESRSTSNLYYYYTNNVFPTTGFTALTYNYYDNYNWNNDGSSVDGFTTTPFPATGPEGQTIPTPTVTTSTVKGVATMVLTHTVGPGFAGEWLMNVTFFDVYGRAIQTRSNSQLNGTGATIPDSKTAAIDFAGKTIATKLIVYSSASVTNTILTTFNYDSSNRVADVDQYYNSLTVSTHISHYNYNEIGQLISKNLGYNTTTAAWLQTVNMRYNIRGQLVNINNPTLTDDGGKTSNETTDLFGMQLYYDGTDSKLGTTVPSYTGRISAAEWMTRNGSNVPTNERSYVYSYDQLGRYTGSKYAELATGNTSFSTNVDGFDENGITYDDGGNILSLLRNSSSIGATTHMQVDDLVYNYDSTQPNKLNTITDGLGTNYTSLGFRNYTGSTGPYVYDPEGNLVTDPYKALSISYSANINRATTITQTASSANGAYISYTYNVSGNVMRKQVYSSSTVLQSTTDYVDGLVFTTTGTTSTLSYFAMPEGRVVNSGTALIPEYVITDQQGNARFSFEDNGSGGITIRQENSSYATGEGLANSPVATPTTPNINIYNGGSEWQNEFSNLPDYHQTFFRNYDPAIGRFIASDPEPESAADMTTYQYAGNNPVMMNDPAGDVTGTGPRPPKPPLYLQYSGIGQNYTWGDNSDDNADPRFDSNFTSSSAALINGTDDNNIDYAHEDPSLMADDAANGDAAAASALQNYAQENGTTYQVVWNPYGGGEVSDVNYWFSMGGSRSQYAAALASVGGDADAISLNLGAYQLKQANQGGDPGGGDPGGSLNPFKLMGHYMGGSGTPYLLTREAFNELVVKMYNKPNGIDFKQGRPVPGNPGLYQVAFSAYGTGFYDDFGVGSATFYYNSTGVVGYSDWWDFDPQSNRSPWAEEATLVGHNVGSVTNGQPFWVYYGITPGLTQIPKNP